jgi:hypothetical protein
MRANGGWLGTIPTPKVSNVKLVAASFAWPLRGNWLSRFAIGALMILFLPIAFIPLLGYAIAATRSAEQGPGEGPPPWRLSRRLLVDGFWTALVLLLLSAPFILALSPLANAVDGARIWPSGDRAVSRLYATFIAAFPLALLWGLLLLLLMPNGASRFAATGRPRDLFDFPATLGEVKRNIPGWNVAAAAIVTAWVVAVACVGLLCVGLVPGVFYAILVSAHASATLHSPARASDTHPSTG